LICGTCVRSDASGLQRHVEFKHPPEFEKLRPFLRNNKTKPHVEFKKKAKVNPLTVFLTRKDLIDAAVETCTKNHGAFNYFTLPAVRKMFNAITDAITRETGKHCPIFNPRNVRAMVTKYATQVRQKIGEETKNRMISLKVDGASRGSRTLFGINAQYMLDGAITIRNLAVKELKTSSSGVNLCKAVMEVLDEYKINLQQVVSITCDNGANMILTTKILSNVSEVMEFEEDEEEEGFEDVMEEEDEVNDTDGFQEEMNEEIITENGAYLRKLRAYIEEGCQCLQMQTLQCLRCAAHTTQLCALDVLNDRNDDAIKVAFFKVRDVVKFMRKKSNGFSDLIIARKMVMPGLDCPTRWFSSFDMFEKLLLIKPFFDEENIFVLGRGKEELHLDDDFWEFVKVYCTAFAPLKRAILVFQKETLSLSEFYNEWLKLKLLVNNKMEQYMECDDTPYSAIYLRLSDAIAARELDLFDNEALYGCLYLDPRFQVIFFLLSV
jgi:hypothetical protein